MGVQCLVAKVKMGDEYFEKIGPVVNYVYHSGETFQSHFATGYLNSASRGWSTNDKRKESSTATPKSTCGLY